MAEKSDVVVIDSNKLSMVTVHETPFLTISVKLDGTNYCVWSQIMEMYIAGKRKKGYITGRKAELAETDADYDEWEAEDKTVKSWLITSMTGPLMAQFVQYRTAKEVWDAIKRMSQIRLKYTN